MTPAKGRGSGWPTGWSAALRGRWQDLGLDVAEARSFREWGWTPTAALAGIGQLADDQIQTLFASALPVPPGSNLEHAVVLLTAGVQPQSAEWDTRAARVVAQHGANNDIVQRLRPEDDPDLAVLTALHAVDVDPPADVALARHADQGCACDKTRFSEYLSIDAMDQHEAPRVVVMRDSYDTVLEIRTGPYLAVRVEAGHWLRLPDLASACWYLYGQSSGEMAAAEDAGTGLRCLTAMAQLQQPDESYEVDVDGTMLSWNGSAFLPGYEVPDWMVVAEDQWEGSHTSPMDSGGVTYLIELSGSYYFGGDEMGWEEVGPFDSAAGATAWFEAELAPIKADYSDPDSAE